MSVRSILNFHHDGSLRSYVWPKDLPVFGRRNLIYGWNGTGKSSISRMFSDLERRAMPEDCEVVLDIDGSNVSGQDFPASDVGIRVFNREFVDKTVAESSAGRGLRIVVGKESVDLADQLGFLDALFRQMQDSLGRLERASRASKELESRLLEQQAKAFKDKIRATGDNGELSNYNKRMLLNDLKTGPSLPRESRFLEFEESELTSRARGEIKPELELIDFDTVESLDALWSGVEALTKRTVDYQSIPALANTPALEAWVGEGLALHEEFPSRDCHYCGNPQSSERTARLSGHFTDARTALAGKVSELTQKIELVVAAGVLGSLPSGRDAYVDEVHSVTEANRELSVIEATTKAHALVMVQLLTEKARHLSDALAPGAFTAVPISGDALGLAKFNDEGDWRELRKAARDVDSRLASSVTDWNQLASAHNGRVESAESDIRDARVALRHQFVMGLAADWSECRESRVATDELLNQVQGEAELIERELIAVRDSVSDHMRAADELNEDLAMYLGHTGVQFKDADGGYILKNRGGVGSSLSEGEKTAVALLYFLKALEDMELEAADCIVVIDDPVSSLDDGALFAAFGAIKSSTRRVKQLFLLTHNFRLLRLARSWFVSATEDHSTDGLYMLRRTNSGSPHTTSLVGLDPLLASYDSDYHFLFAELASEANSQNVEPLEYYYSIPNQARRLLESFLDFRFPAGADLSAKVNQIDYHAGQRERVLRYVQELSHAGGRMDRDIDTSLLAESRSVLRVMFAMMQAEDYKHYKRMCRATNVGAIQKPRFDPTEAPVVAH